MLIASEYRDDLDIVQIIHTPKGEIDLQEGFIIIPSLFEKLQ